MWIEATVTREDLGRLFAQLLPLTIEIGTQGDHIALTDPGEVSLVPGRGVRLTCRARVRWSVLGIAVPITIHTVRALLCPEIVAGAAGETLALRAQIEHADIAAVPALLDARIVERANELLESRREALAWHFAQALTRTIVLPPMVRPPASFLLGVSRGEVRVTESALSFGLGLDAGFVHETALEATGAAPVSDPPAAAPDRTVARTRALPPAVLYGAAAAVAVAGAYGLTLTAPRRARAGGWLGSTLRLAAAGALIDVATRALVRGARSARFVASAASFSGASGRR